MVERPRFQIHALKAPFVTSFGYFAERHWKIRSLKSILNRLRRHPKKGAFASNGNFPKKDASTKWPMRKSPVRRQREDQARKNHSRREAPVKLPHINVVGADTEPPHQTFEVSPVSTDLSSVA